MILRIYKTEYTPEKAAGLIRELYREKPNDCYFMTTWRRIGCEWKGSMTYPLFRFPVVRVREWNYEDLFEFMMMHLRLPEDDVKRRIRFLSEINKMVQWRPLAIADDVLVFDVLSSDREILQEVGSRVTAFQESCGFQVFHSIFEGNWIGSPRKSFVRK